MDRTALGYTVAEESEIHDKALARLAECIEKTDSVTLLAKLFQNAELKGKAFARLKYLGFEKNNPEALNEIVQITTQSRNAQRIKEKNRTSYLRNDG